MFPPLNLEYPSKFRLLILLNLLFDYCLIHLVRWQLSCWSVAAGLFVKMVLNEIGFMYIHCVPVVEWMWIFCSGKSKFFVYYWVLILLEFHCLRVIVVLKFKAKLLLH